MTFFCENENGLGSIQSSTQIFPNRELWGIDSTLLAERDFIPSKAFEDMVSSGVGCYVTFAMENLGYKFPIIIEAGATGVQGYRIAMGNEYFNPYWGPIYVNEICLRQELIDGEKENLHSVLLKIFEEFFDATGQRRPKDFNNFPAHNN